MTKELLKIGPTEIEVTFKAIKNLHLSVHPPDGRVTISSPDFYDLEKVKIYAASKWGWIKREQEKIISQARETPRQYITQESHYLFGKRYLLEVIQAPKNRVVKKANKLQLLVKAADDVSLKNKTLYQFYRKELRKRLDVVVKQYSTIMDVEVPQYGIRAMKTKWGSCANDKNYLWFNIELAKKPLECIEYIVVHELIHLLERNHNKNFVMLMNRYLPNWRVQKKVLNELPL